MSKLPIVLIPSASASKISTSNASSSRYVETHSLHVQTQSDVLSTALISIKLKQILNSELSFRKDLEKMVSDLKQQIVLI